MIKMHVLIFFFLFCYISRCCLMLDCEDTMSLRKRDSVCCISVFFFCLNFLRCKSSALCLHCVAHPSLSSPSLEPPSVLQSSPVTPAFSPNVNPNRLSTEGYCSSSQKRRQIFRYWGAADLCVAMHIF